MARTTVLPALGDVSTRPYNLKPTEAAHLLSMGLVERVSRRAVRSLRKKTVDPAIVSAAGYDRAVKATPVDDFMQVWAMRKSGRVIDMWQYTANKDSVALA